jgi:hypothetical protein
LAYCGNLLIENHNGLVVDTELVQCSGSAERDAALQMAERIDGVGRVTLAADKGYDTRDLVTEMRPRAPLRGNLIDLPISSTRIPVSVTLITSIRWLLKK